MRFLHTMLRVNDLDESLRFYTEHFGMKLLRRKDFPEGKFTLAFLGYGDESEHTVLEFTHNWGKSDYVLGDQYGHIALGVERHLRRLCEPEGERREDPARARPDEARQHRDRVRRGSERVQDRADSGNDPRVADLMLKRVVAFINGQNIVCRYQEMLAAGRVQEGICSER